MVRRIGRLRGSLTARDPRRSARSKPNVGLAYCQSWAVDEQGAILYNLIDTLECHFETCRWKSDYVNSGRDECRFLFWTNTIPNASAVLMRRKVLERAGGPPRDMLLAGDWLLYVKMLSISDVAFVSAPLNYFRHHDAPCVAGYLTIQT